MNPMYAVLPMFVVFFLILLTVNQYSALEWIVLLCFLSITGFFGIQYFLGVDLTATLSSFFSKPSVNVDIVTDKDKTSDTTNPTDPTNTTDPTNPTDQKKSGPETYHVQGQFDYSMAKSVCKAYDATLASLTQIKEAYDKGAEWCDYGWSEDGMVLYPTQEDSWKLYQKEKKDKCGIPGINGGYNPRTRQRLGVNCYGVKPSGMMPLYPSPVEKPTLPKQGTISPFNYKAWSQL
jgi:hypothetical protein